MPDLVLVGAGSGMLRCTFMYNYSDMGWTETWWRDGATIGSTIPLIQDYVKRRMATQPVEVEFAGVRVSQEGQSRKSRLFSAGFNEGSGTDYDSFTLLGRGQYRTPSGVTWDLGRMAIQTEVVAQGVRVGFRYFAILPDPVSTTDPVTIQFNAVPSWKIAMGNFFVGVLGGGWKVRVTQSTQDRPEVPINGWIRSTDPEGNWSFVLRPQNALAGLAVGKYVHIRGARTRYSGVQSPNGKQRITKVVAINDPDTLTVTLEGTAGLSLQHLVSQGVVYLAGKQYLAPSRLSPWACTKHKRGGPFPRVRGRRSKPRFPPS